MRTSISRLDQQCWALLTSGSCTPILIHLEAFMSPASYSVSSRLILWASKAHLQQALCLQHPLRLQQPLGLQQSVAQLESPKFSLLVMFRLVEI